MNKRQGKQKRHERHEQFWGISKKIGHWALGITLSVLLLLAASINLGAYLIKNDPQVKAKVLSYISEYRLPGIDLSFAEFDIVWRRLTPEILLQDVELALPPAGLTAHADSVSIRINQLAAFYGGELVKVRVHRGQAEALLPDFTDWLKRQRAAPQKRMDLARHLNFGLVLDDFELTTNRINSPYFMIEKLLVNAAEGGERLKFKANGKLHRAAEEISDVKLMFSRGYIDDNLYVKFDNFGSPEALAETLADLDADEQAQKVLDGVETIEGAAEIWLDYSQSEKLAMTARLELERLVLDFPQTQRLDINNFKLISGVDWRSKGAWDLDITEVSFAFAGARQHRRGISFADVRLSRNLFGLSVISPQQDLDTVNHFFINAIRQENTVADLRTFDLRGELNNLEFNLKLAEDLPDQPKFTMDAELVDVSANPVRRVPGALEASGRLSIQGKTGTFVLDDDNSQLFLPTLYKDPFGWDYAKGVFMWESLAPGELVLVGISRDIRKAQMQGAMDLSVHTSKGEHTYIDLLVGLGRGDLDDLKEFIPWRGLNPATSNWLDRALDGGKNVRAGVSLKADVKNFDNPASTLEVLVEGEDAAVEYREGREPILAPQFDVYLDMDEVRVVLPDGGKIGKIATVERGYANIGIDSADLTVGGQGDVFLSQLPAVVADYLVDDEDRQENFISADGIGEGDWNFLYNLRNKELLQVAFDLTSADAELGLTALPSERVTNISGAISYSTAGYQGQWQGNYKGYAVSGEFVEDLASPNTSAMKIAGTFPVPANLDDSMAGRISGATPFELTAYTLDKQGLMFRRFLLSSELRGIGIDLPAPLSKEVPAAKPFTLEAEILPHQETYALLWGRELSADLYFDQDTLTGVHLGLSPRERLLSQRRSGRNTLAGRGGKGLEIKLLPRRKFDTAAWQTFLLADSAEAATQAAAAKTGVWAENLTKLRAGILEYSERFPRWDITAKNLVLGGTEYTNIDLQHRRSSATRPKLDFSFTAAEGHSADGSLLVPANANRLDLDIELLRFAMRDTPGEDPGQDAAERKKLLERLPTKISPPSSFKRLPEMNIEIRNFYYQNNLVGNINAALITQDKTLQLKLSDSKIFGMDGRGDFVWKLNSPVSSSLDITARVTGNMQSDTLKNVQVQGMFFDFDWQWTGRNDRFNDWHDTATGHLILRSDSGRIVSSRANVLTGFVSFLNIDNLAARFRGDFSDVSSSEFLYKDANLRMDLEQGDYLIREGTEVTVSLIEITADGRYDLAEDNLHLTSVVESSTTNILPLTALLLGASSLAPLLLTLDISGGDFLNSFSSAVYLVNGSLADPQASLVSVSDLAGKQLEPDDLVNRFDIKSRLDGFKF